MALFPEVEGVVVEFEARIIMRVKGAETGEEGEGIGAIEQTEAPVSEQGASLAQRIPQHLPYHHLQVLAVEAALVLA